MANLKISELTENTARHFNDLLVMVDDPAGTPLTQNQKYINATGLIVNAQTGTTYTYLTGDYGKLVTHTNGSAIAGTLPQAGASFPANWFMFVQNRGAGVLTITPTTSTIDGAATLVLNQNEGALIVSDGSNYFTARGKATGAGGVGDVVGPGSSTDEAIARFDSTTGKLLQDSAVTVNDAGAVTVPEIASPSTPASGKVAVYAKSDGKLYIKDDAGTETDLTGTAPSGSAGGDLTGTYPSPTVKDNLKDVAIPFLIDGGGATITTGIKGDLEIPFGCTILAATLLADQSGSIVIDVWKDTYANFPPADADSITASAPPTISTATKSQDSTLTGWTTSISAGDILRFNVDSITTIQRVLVSLKVRKT